MSVALEILDQGLSEAILKIEGIEKAPTEELTEGIGRLVQGQTRRRIEEEKTAPDGSAWKPNWRGSSILFASGALTRSIDYLATPMSVQVGSGLLYARIHQQGGTIRPKTAKALAFMLGNQMRLVQSVTISARPFVGLSAANENEIILATEDWLERLVR